MILLLALLVASNPAAAQQQQPNQVQVPAVPPVPAPVKKERKICRDDPEFTGSRISKTLCLTKSEWERRDSGNYDEGAGN